ncbi:Tartrate-resistant acid phosphatase type 5, partial [Globisporangium splendens]
MGCKRQPLWCSFPHLRSNPQEKQKTMKVFAVAVAALAAVAVQAKQETSFDVLDTSTRDVADPTTQPTTAPTTGTPATSAPAADAPTSDDGYVLHALAIGDWGVTSDPTGSCCSRYKGDTTSPAYNKHRYAQDNVAALLGVSAELLKPKAVLGHGFYWQGLMEDDVQTRFQETFENKYKSEALNIPWFNVMGNHDYGGASFICGHKCNSTEEMLQHLDAKFTRQQQYKSPNDDRWQMKGHYYKETIEAGGVSVDIYNVDTNYATSHGASQICCQCYGYGGDNPVCKDPHPDNAGELCAGGSLDMFNSCMNKLKEWQDDSLTQLERDAKASTATWKIVNSHYSPHFHMSPEMYTPWYKVLKDAGIQLFVNGHTHAESHDHSDSYKTHFITNGAGGGIQSESIGAPPEHAISAVGVNQVWNAAGEPYGYFELSFSAVGLRLQFISTGSGWKPDEQQAARQVQYCYVIPIDGGVGSKCA